jgi:endonuclease G
LLIGLLVWRFSTSGSSTAVVPTALAPTSAPIARPTNSTKPTAKPTNPAKPTAKPTNPAKPTAKPANPTTPAVPSSNRNLLLGNPSGAVHDPAEPTNYLIERPQYALSYNRDHGIPNWVSWQLTKKDLGDTKRSPTFTADTTLPDTWFRATLDDYTGTGYDRGHMCPSADRTATAKDNLATFILTNVVPQAPNNNRGTWEQLESFSRTLVNKGHVLYIIAGGDGENGTIANGKILVPRYTWKIIVVMPKGQSDIARITATTTVIAVRIPNNLDATLGGWEQYRVTVNDIETATGYQFFSNLPADIQTALKSRIDPPPTN